MNREQQNQQVADYWSWVAKRQELGYWNLPGWKEHQNRLASGNEKESWLDVLSRKLPQNAKLALSLGCGDGNLEYSLLEKGICQEAEGCDISPYLIQKAQEKADLQGHPIRYFVADLNEPVFEENRYDLVVAAGILHHIENLEGLFASVDRALKPGGHFLIYDYVGPNRFQWSREQIAHCNRCLKDIPMKLKWKRGYPWYYVVGRALFNTIPFMKSQFVERIISQNGSPWLKRQYLRLNHARLFLNEIKPPHPEQFMVTDPSEAIRSEEILPLLNEKFELTEQLPQGGTIVQPLFMRIVGNFMNQKPLAEKILQEERRLIHEKKVSSDFVAALYKKKASF